MIFVGFSKNITNKSQCVNTIQAKSVRISYILYSYILIKKCSSHRPIEIRNNER